MSEAHFSLRFCGPAVENGEIDVQDLAPAMLALGDLIQSANDVVNGPDAKVAVRVRATSEGSFEVDFSLVQKIIDSIFTYAENNKDGITAAKELAGLVLMVGGGLSGGLFALLKFLRGKRPEKIQNIDDGKVEVHIDGNIFITNNKTIKLAKDLEVRQNARKVVASLEKEGMDYIAAKQEGESELIIERSDVSYFDIPDSEEEEISDDIRQMTLQIISLSFKEDNKWRLTDGAEPFTASISDPEFLKEIANDQIKFGKNDYLVCEVRERQINTPKGLKKTREIVKVIEHRPAARQMKLI